MTGKRRRIVKGLGVGNRAVDKNELTDRLLCRGAKREERRITEPIRETGPAGQRRGGNWQPEQGQKNTEASVTCFAKFWSEKVINQLKSPRRRSLEGEVKVCLRQQGLGCTRKGEGGGG